MPRVAVISKIPFVVSLSNHGRHAQEARGRPFDRPRTGHASALAPFDRLRTNG
jgi:hypothetical protein